MKKALPYLAAALALAIGVVAFSQLDLSGVNKPKPGNVPAGILHRELTQGEKEVRDAGFDLSSVATLYDASIAGPKVEQTTWKGDGMVVHMDANAVAQLVEPSGLFFCWPITYLHAGDTVALGHVLFHDLSKGPLPSGLYRGTPDAVRPAILVSQGKDLSGSFQCKTGAP